MTHLTALPDVKNMAQFSTSYLGALRTAAREADTPEDVPSLDEIIHATAVATGTGSFFLKGRMRAPRFAIDRTVAYVVCRHYGYTWRAIGAYFKRKHSAIISSVQHHENLSNVQEGSTQVIAYFSDLVNNPDKNTVVLNQAWPKYPHED